MRILVVEDDEHILQVLTTILNSQNYVVEVAIDGQAGWNLIDTFDYDLILLDVVLPKLNGIDLCRQIRAKGLSMPILLLTARDNSHDKAIGLDAGADDYVVKPFDAEELVARIRALLRRGGTISQPVLEWGKLRLDPTSFEVTYNAKLLALTPKEYAMLELLLRNSRRVFSCGMMLEHLWSYNEMPGEEAVRTHIKGLRQKLKGAGATGDLIETVYGIGYRLKPLAVEKSDEKPQDKQVAPGSNEKALEQETRDKIAAVWQRFQGRVSQQLSRLEQAAEAAVQANLSSESRSLAEQEAHSLAGALGMFGIPEGSKLARQIEALLKENSVPGCDQAIQFQSWVRSLRQEVEKASVTSQTPSEPPLLLIVDRDRQSAEPLIQESAKWGLRAAIVTNLSAARKALYSEHPSMVLFDPDTSDSAEDSLSLLRELHQRKPPVPVFVLTAQTDLSHRLQLARRGQTFLPKSASPSEVLTIVTQRLQQTDSTEPKILIVDDDPKILAVLQSLLEPWGLKVTTLENSHQFWETLEAVSPDLLILDVEMPGITGIDLCRVVRNDSRWSELPIVFLTAHTDAAIVNQVFEIGADDFVSKPIVGAELVTRIINRLERNKMLQRIAKTHQLQKNSSHDQSEKLLQRSSVSETSITELIQLNEQLQVELDEQQRTQEALHISQARLAGILNVVDDAVIAIDASQKVTLFNRGAEKTFGYTAQEILGQPLDRLLPSIFSTAHSLITHATNSTQSDRNEWREILGHRKDGTDFSAEVSISKLVLADETIFTVVLRDASDRKQIERMKDDFVSVVSHELRTPLTSIHGSLGMLASGLLEADSDAGKRLLQIAVDSTDRLVRLINDILDIERIESGEVRMNKQTYDVADLISEAVEAVQPIADEANVTLSISSVSANIKVDGDRIVQTLTNLLSNAIKFSSSGAIVWLSVEPQCSNTLLLKIKDQGRGIPPNKLDNIFKRFQQVDSSDSRTREGTGLGLAICRSIVQQHKGQIWAESNLGEGSTVCFTLPV